MSVENLKFVVGADVNELLNALGQSKKSLGDFKDQLARFRAALDKSTDPASILRLNKAIDASVTKIKTISTAGVQAGGGLTKLGDSSKSAGFAMQNLSRVAQDLPYGFIGIQNNLNPLLESFQRLKAETGSTGGALKALGSSLIGAGGIGLALGVASTAITFITMGFDAWTRGMSGTKKSVNDLALELSSFSSVVQDSKTRVEDLNKQLEYTRKLADINLRIVIGDDFKRSITAFEQKFLSQGELTAKLEKEILILTENASNAFGLFVDKASKGANELYDTFGSLLRIPEDMITELNKTDQGLVKGAIAAEKALTDTHNKLTESRKTSVLVSREIAALQTEEIRRLDEIAKKEAERFAKLPSISKTIAELSREITFLNAKGIALGTDEDVAKISAIFSTIEKLIKDFKVAPDDTIIKKLLGDKTNDLFGNTLGDLVQNINSLKLRDAIQEKIKEATKAAPVKITVPIIPEIKLSKDALTPFLVDVSERITAAMESLGQGIANTIGETIGAALAGAAGVGDFFKGIFSQLGAAMVELGKFFIQTGIQIKLIKQFLIKNPVIAIAGGIALIAIGNLIKSKTNKNAFATGVNNFSGGSAIVGERGREIVQLPRGANVIPANQTSSILGGQHITVGGYVDINGQMLRVVLQRADAQFNRNN